MPLNVIVEWLRVLKKVISGGLSKMFSTNVVKKLNVFFKKGVVRVSDSEPVVKKKYSVYGNCQADPLGNILRTNPDFNEQWEFVQFPKPSFELRKNDLPEIEKLVGQLDLFVTQNVGDSHGVFASDNLAKLLKPSSTVIRIPNAYFSGYMPEVVYFRDGEPHVTKFCDYHDEKFLSFFMEDPVNAVNKAVNAANDTNTYSRDFVIENAKNSLEELKNRELSCDVTVSDYIEKHWREEILFFSMNHPKRKVLNHIASQVLSRIGQSSTDVRGDYEHLDNTRLPVYQSVKDVLLGDIEWTLALRQQDIDLQTYYEGHAKVLRSLEPEFLRNAYKKFLEKRNIAY
ncbi:hypothetical protein KUL49_31150 [Alteromonas sp. KUL49]|nr:hypothetical protein KUL49_31150 [Alteromonas sp. KUL49]